MPRKTETPDFQSPAETLIYDSTPKWQIWEAAMLIAARDAKGKAEDNLHNGKALTTLMDEIAGVVAKRDERREDRPKVPPAPPRGNTQSSDQKLQGSH